MNNEREESSIDSYRQHNEDCFLCEKDIDLEKKIQQKATKSAHILSIQQASKVSSQKEYPDLPWESIQSMYFPVIYKHEFQRWQEYLNEINQDRVIQERLSDKTKQVSTCSYHSENIGWFGTKFHEEVMNKVKTKFAKSKWPKKQYY